jgi:hypothetical protein
MGVTQNDEKNNLAQRIKAGIPGLTGVSRSLVKTEFSVKLSSYFKEQEAYRASCSLLTL